MVTSQLLSTNVWPFLLCWSCTFYRCPAIFDLLLRCLAAYMATAKTFLHEQAHVQNCTAMASSESAGGHMTQQERDELCIALIATQESSMIQLLLEVCVPTDEDKEVRREGRRWGSVGLGNEEEDECRC